MPSLVVPSCLAGTQLFSKTRVYDEKYILDMVRDNRITLFLYKSEQNTLIITRNDHIIK